MISIIIERSKEKMQVVWVYYWKTSAEVWDIANSMAEDLVDYDVYEFEGEDALNMWLRVEAGK